MLKAARTTFACPGFRWWLGVGTTRSCFLLGLMILSPPSVMGAGRAEPTPRDSNFEGLSLGATPWEFEPNRGQAHPSVRFQAARSGYTAYLTQTGIAVAYASRHTDTGNGDRKPAPSELVSLDLIGATPAAECTGQDEQTARTHYLIGDDPGQWVPEVPSFGHVYCRAVYPGIDLKVHGNDRGLEYDFIVAAGADPRDIELKLAGGRTLTSNPAGDLVLTLRDGETLTHRRPVAYQEISGRRKPVQARYLRRNDRVVAFRLGPYDRSRPLVIDPTISHATFLGGSNGPGSFDFGRDKARGIAVDNQGNTYVTGGTSSRNFPGTPQTPPATDTRVFVTKYSPSGQRLFSTFFGGTIGFAGGRPVDNAYAIAVDSTGETCITGGTSSKNFPTLGKVYQRAATPGLGDGEGPTYAFLARLNAQGSWLLFSTYLHGSVIDNSPPVTGEVTDDWGYDVAADGQGRCYATGITNTQNFKVTPNAYQPQSNKPGLNHDYTAWVARFARDGEAEYVTYLGGSTSDSGFDISADQAGRAYVVGTTRSADFPLFLPFDSTLGGASDAFVTVFNPAGTALVYSTLLGGANIEAVKDIALTGDALPELLVTGATKSSDFPMAGADPDLGDNYDIYVARVAPFQPGAQSLRGARYFGGNGNDGFGQDFTHEAEALGAAIAVNAARAYLVGSTTSTNFPGSNPQRHSFFISMRPTPPFDVLESSLLPGTRPKAIAAEVPGMTAVTGIVLAEDAPLFSQFITPGASQPQFGGGPSDAFFLKTCDCSDLPAHPRVLPTALTLGPWTATVETSDDDGLTLRDVQLGGRYLAQMVSLPYLSLQTSAYSNDRVELRPDDTGSGAAASRLIGYEVRSPGAGGGTYGPAVVEATYQVRNISSSNQSCLLVQQVYEFFGTIDEEESPRGLHCEPSQTFWLTKPLKGLTCARLNPLVRYAYCGLEGDSLVSIKSPQRFHFTIERSPQASILLIRDTDTLFPPLPFGFPFNVIGANPHAVERQYSTINTGQTVPFSADNYHQSLGVTPVETPAPPPACPECVHTHWRWGRFLSFPQGHPPGSPVIPAGSNQSLDFATVRFHPGEEDPANGFESLVNSEATVGTDNVFWYSATGRRASDTFFSHGLFYSPEWTRGNERWRVQFGAQSSQALRAGDEPDGTPPDPGITVFTPIDPASLGPFPACFVPYGNNAVEITTPGTLGSDPVIITHVLPDLSDLSAFERLRLLHREGVTLIDRTDLANTSFRERRVQAEVDTLGAFVLASRKGPVISAPKFVPPSTGGHVASVTNNPGNSYAWTLTGGGQIAPPSTTPSVTFTAGPPGATMVLQCVEQGTCGATAQRRVQVDFADVPASSVFRTAINTLAGNGITSGCGGGNYCPGHATVRNQMSLFVLLSREGGSYVPPACQTGQERFTDVPASNGFCPWIEEAARRGITAGCAAPNQFCPADPITRRDMAIWLLLGRHDGHFVPAPCTAPPFNDVPASSPYCPWIQELKNRGITSGCGGGNYCPTNVVTRQEMAAFLMTTFQLVFP